MSNFSSKNIKSAICNSHNKETAFIKEQASLIQTKDDFELAKNNCIKYAWAYSGTTTLSIAVAQAMELYAKVVEAYNESCLNPITAPFTDWLKPQDLDSPDFEAAHKCHDWRNYVSHNIQDNWGLLTNRERSIIAIMGQAQADSDGDWD